MNLVRDVLENRKIEVGKEKTDGFRMSAYKWNKSSI